MHGLADVGLLAPAPDRLQTWLPSSTLLTGHASESAILTRTFSGSSRDAHFPLHCSLIVFVSRRRNGMSSPLGTWWTLAEAMAYARARVEWRTSDDTTIMTTTIRVRFRLIPLENESEFAREETFKTVDSPRLSVSRRQSERKNCGEHSVARTQRDEDWGLLSTHWRSLVPPPRRALPLPPSRLIAILLGTSYLEDCVR